MKLKLIATGLLMIGFPAGNARAQTHPLKLEFEDRVAAQRAIETVYWKHRLWPAENEQSKPSLSSVVPEQTIRRRVEETLKKSSALEQYWRRPISSDQLQAEVERMVAGSKDSRMLRELFAALDDDPTLIAETLARPLLAGRLLRNWFAYDATLHQEARQRAERALAHETTLAGLRAEADGYSETKWRLTMDGEDPGPLAPAREGTAGIVSLSAEEWSSFRSELTRRHDIAKGAMPSHVTQLRETMDGFVVTALLTLEDDSATVATFTWRKVSFDSWWAKTRGTIATAVPDPDGFYTLVLPVDADCVDDTWRTIPADIPTPHYGNTAVWTGSEMIVWGGAAANGLSPDGYRYSPATDTWSLMSHVGAPPPRESHTAVWSGTEMILYGGSSGEQFFDSGGRYDPSTDTWTSLPASGIGARRGHSAVWAGTEMIVWGGATTVGYTDSGGRFRPSAGTWSLTSFTGAPSSRAGHTAVWTGSVMIVWGGTGFGNAENTGGRYNPATNVWSATSLTGAPQARSGHKAVWTSTEMILWGGLWSDQYLATGGRYNPTSNSWFATSNTSAPSGRVNHTAIWTGSRMIVFGGNSNEGVLKDGGLYNPSSSSWAPTTTIGASARSGHTAVWTGSEMIAWGGGGDGGEGSRYDPPSNSWVPTAHAAEPRARYGHAAVWTGTEMIVWGGEPGWSSGGRFDPATDDWTWTPTTGAPTGRTRHTAVWTGTEMIVWGGIDGYYTSTGGRFNPATDTWVATGDWLSGAPLSRSDHAAVWTGSEMIIWGGFLNGTLLGDGGRFNPAQSAWRPMSSTGAPTARMFHTAVFTGQEMIVWGGTNGSWGGVPPGSTGGRYDPLMDTWAPTSLLDAPDPRSTHFAVWTGSMMIVGGGGSILGARYYPATDEWLGTSTGPGAPSSRVDATAVWTGRQIIVWGGAWNPGPLNDGARYHPSRDQDGWEATTVVGAPSPRVGHSAVWTGTQMIVWGGNSGYSSNSYSGPEIALYCASRPSCVGAPGLCDDDDPCTNDACEGATDECTHALQGSAPQDVADSVRLEKAGGVSRVRWTGAPFAATHDVTRGGVTFLPVGPGGGDEACLANGSTQLQWSDPQVPVTGSGYWYLVRGKNACGNGGYGSQASHGLPVQPRVSTSCP